MAKVIRCSDAGLDCNEVVRGETEDEVLQKALEHGKTAHGIQASPEMTQQVRGLIKNE